jgi:hypothetical protein
VMYPWYMAKVAYTLWIIHHTKYYIDYVMRVANEVCMDCASGWRGPLLFSTVHIKVTINLKWLRL